MRRIIPKDKFKRSVTSDFFQKFVHFTVINIVIFKVEVVRIWIRIGAVLTVNPEMFDFEIIFFFLSNARF
jgi:hypothetical protein